MTTTMWDCIQDQPDRVSASLESVRVDERFESVRALLARNGAPRHVMVLATGSSSNAVSAMRLHAERVIGAPVTVMEPTLFTQYGTAYADVDLVVAVSQRGTSSSTLEAADRIRVSGTPLVVITAAPSSPLAVRADAVLDMGIGDEVVLYSTIGVSATMATFAVLASEIAVVARRPVGPELGVDAVRRIVDQYPAVLERGLALADDRDLVTTARRISVIGSGPNVATAREAETKIAETCRIPVQGEELEAFMHGPVFEMQREHTVLLMDVPGSPASNRTRQFARFAARHCDHVATVSTGPSAAGVIGLDLDVPDLLSPLVLVIPFQLYSWRLSQYRGVDLTKQEFDDFDEAMKTKVS
ncbi:SIS domain-containing protein [Microbacterium aurugineum]|uniref:SIS domain-containing protein n=1 Tax=Microbacterium aurugineum TaxID=2851642 RepID=UPI0020C0FD6D|nr:SIS domain-containing protein [Microbacterium aurugineum]MCK8478295.1 SIS domain-containing protein [Microbacterium aurugineum]